MGTERKYRGKGFDVILSGKMIDILFAEGQNNEDLEKRRIDRAAYIYRQAFGKKIHLESLGKVNGHNVYALDQTVIHYFAKAEGCKIKMNNFQSEEEAKLYYERYKL